MIQGTVDCFRAGALITSRPALHGGAVGSGGWTQKPTETDLIDLVKWSLSTEGYSPGEIDTMTYKVRPC